jgi:hypothetical protein
MFLGNWQTLIANINETEVNEMSIIAKNEGGDFKQLEPGTHFGRCYMIIDLGHQRNEFEGQVSVKHQVMVAWEVPTERLEDGQPLAISKFYTLSLHPKSNMGQDLVSWRGRQFTPEEEAGFDVSKLIGVPAMLSVVDKKGKSRVSSVSGLPKGTSMEDQVNPSTIFSMEDYRNGDTSVFDTLSEGIQGMILKSEDLKVKEDFQSPIDERNPPDDGFTDDIPF